MKNGASHCCCYYLVLRTACSDWPASQTSLLRKLLASRVGASHPLVLCTIDISNAHLRLMYGCSGARGNVEVSVFFFLDVCAFICGYCDKKLVEQALQEARDKENPETNETYISRPSSMDISTICATEEPE